MIMSALSAWTPLVHVRPLYSIWPSTGIVIDIDTTQAAAPVELEEEGFQGRSCRREGSALGPSLGQPRQGLSYNDY